MIEVQLVRLAKNTGPPERALEWISLERRARIARFHQMKDRKRSLVAELLIRRAAIRKLGLRPEQLVIDRNPYGRPYLRNVRHFKFNLSHSGEYVVIALGRRPLGVDVERIDRCNQDVAKRFFSPAEAEYLRSLPEAEQARAFTTLWTLKESYTKAEGKGLLIPFSSFGFRLEPAIQLVGGCAKRDYVFESMVLDGHCLSVCHQEPGAEMDFRILDETELYEQYERLLESL